MTGTSGRGQQSYVLGGKRKSVGDARVHHGPEGGRPEQQIYNNC